MGTVTVIDYGVGNLLSVARALEFCGGEVEVTSDPTKIRSASRLVLPGVGAFGDCIGELRSRRIDDAILQFTASGRPMLGICVGMQIMFEHGTEFGEHTGLGLLSGTVEEIPRVRPDGSIRRIPHIGWAPLDMQGDRAKDSGNFLSSVRTGEAVYFVHSFHAVPSTPELIVATADYDGLAVCAAVAKGNVLGCQFHPEKSGQVGLRILDNFLHL